MSTVESNLDPFPDSSLEDFVVKKKVVVQQERESWETARSALPEHPQSGPLLRAFLAINALLDAVQDVIGRTPEDPERLCAVDVIDRVLGAALRCDPETHATVAFVAQIRSCALDRSHRKKSPSLLSTFFKVLWPEYPIDPSTYERVVNAWLVSDSGKRADVWGAIADAVAAAGLARRPPATLKREWLAWQREIRVQSGETENHR